MQAILHDCKAENSNHKRYGFEFLNLGKAAKQECSNSLALSRLVAPSLPSINVFFGSLIRVFRTKSRECAAQLLQTGDGLALECAMQFKRTKEEEDEDQGPCLKSDI